MLNPNHLAIFDNKHFGRGGDGDGREQLPQDRGHESWRQDPRRPKGLRGNRRFLGFDFSPPIGPRVLMKRNSSIVEFFYRVMYIVFLAYSAFVIGAGVLSIYSILGQIFIGPFMPWGWAVNVIFLLLLFYLGYVRDFWERKFDLFRMDANFSGIGYLEAHLDNPNWEYAKELFDRLSMENLSPIDKEVLRRELARLARSNPSIYEAIYELSDERLRWTLVYAKID